MHHASWITGATFFEIAICIVSSVCINSVSISVSSGSSKYNASVISTVSSVSDRLVNKFV